MVRIDTDNMTIAVDSVDLSKYIDDVQEDGGVPMYITKKKFCNTLTKTLVGYEDWNITLSVDISENPAAIATFISNFNSNSTSTIVIGTSGIRQTTYSNAIPEGYSSSMSADGNILIGKFTFIVPGMASNKVVS